MLDLHIPRLEIYGRNGKRFYIPVITISVITVATNRLSPDFPASLVQSSETISIFQFARLRKNESAFSKGERRSSETDPVYVVKTPGALYAIFVVFKNVFAAARKQDECKRN